MTTPTPADKIPPDMETPSLDILQSDPVNLLQRHAQEVREFFDELPEWFSATPPRLLEAIQYSLLAGGKRLRPALVLESFDAAGGASTSRAVARAAAGAIELIHTFSLVHDDLPDMDNDDLRRGRPTNHKVFGAGMAILAGDAMTVMAFDILARRGRDRAPALIRELAGASGPEGMIGGQALDIDNQGRILSMSRLQQLHAMKTGALLQASCRMGAIAADAPDPVVASLSQFGRHLGLAFQIVDDLLDLTATPRQLGKATKKDAAKGKNTYPSLLGIDASRDEAARQLEQALDCLSEMDQKADGLRSLARFVVERGN